MTASKPMKTLLTIPLCLFIAMAASAAVYTNTPSDKDAFVRALSPTLNYGGGGAVSISGTNPTSGNPTNGAFDTFMSFNTRAMATNFNSIFGASNWVVTSATMNLTENPAPGNPVFNSGNGRFQIRWIANDTWTEGTGTPMAPTMNGITYNQESTYLNSNIDQDLGVFDFTGATTTPCSLSLPTAFVTNMIAGGEVGFFMTAIDTSLGVVFYSRSFAGNPKVLPQLVVTAASPPAISSITPAGPNLVLACTNGIAGGTYYVLTSTTLNLPAAQWAPMATNVLSASGNFNMTLTNAANISTRQFYILQTY